MDIITGWDFILFPIYFLIVYAIGSAIKNRNVGENKVYKYYLKGLIVKIGGGFIFCCIYIFYYKGGDTLAYWKFSGILNNMLSKNFSVYLDILGGDLSMQNYYHFDSSTGFPEYWKDAQSFATIRFTSPLYFLTVKSYFACTLLLSALSYAGIWRLYLLFTREFPGLEKQFAIAILYFPSMIFWGSGIMKDTYTLAAACWFTYSIYMVFIKREKIIPNVFWLIFTAYIMVSFKPYIFIALLPGTLVWVSFKRIQAIESPVFKVLIAPVIIAVFFVLGSFVLSSLSSDLKQYSSVDSMLEKAVVSQYDLKQDYYGGNSFDIGEFDGSIGGIFSKFPLAVTAGLFRPFIFEARNPVMFISGVENTFLLIFTLVFLFRVGPIKILKYVVKEPLLLFSLTFAIFFAFGIGLSTSNFGALVRYKIPCIPFYLSSLYIMREHFLKKEIAEGNSVV